MVPAWSTSGISGATIWYQHHPRHRPKPPGGIIGPVITGNAFFPIWYHIHGFVGPRELGWSDTLYSFLESDGPVQCNAPTCCTPGVPTVYPYPQHPWLTEPGGRRVRVLIGTGTGQPGITWGLPVLIPTHK